MLYWIIFFVLFYGLRCSSPGYDFKYYREITINAPDDKKYDVLLTIDTFELYSNGLILSDCSDIVFYFQETAYYYWMQNECLERQTNIWLNLELIKGDNTLGMYYGSRTGSGSDTQIPFEGDFLFIEQNGDCNSVKMEFFDDSNPDSIDRLLRIDQESYQPRGNSDFSHRHSFNFGLYESDDSFMTKHTPPVPDNYLFAHRSHTHQ